MAGDPDAAAAEGSGSSSQERWLPYPFLSCSPGIFEIEKEWFEHEIIIPGGEVASPEAVTSPQPPSFDDEMLELINEYFYGVRIFPGQDLDGTYVGWVRFHSLLLDGTNTNTPVAR